MAVDVATHLSHARSTSRLNQQRPYQSVLLIGRAVDEAEPNLAAQLFRSSIFSFATQEPRSAPWALRGSSFTTTKRCRNGSLRRLEMAPIV